MIAKMKRAVQKTAGKLGYKIIKKPSEGLHEDMDEGFKKIYEECREYTMTSTERMYALYKSVEYVVNLKIPGDFVECGVWKGGSSMIIARTLLKMKEKNSKIYLYDTYEGLSEPTKEDKKLIASLSAVDEWGKRQKEDHIDWCFSPLEEVKKNMLSTKYPKKNLIFIKGKVEDTIPLTVPPKIALLRLDTDWYESTYHELKYLFPLLSNKGALIIDDYGCWAGAKKAVDTYFDENKIVILLNRIDYTGRLGIKV